MITRPISRSISRGISLAINDPNGAGFDPRSLFDAGEQGVWYDPSDLSTLFQDAAGTAPVTAAGQPVGLMRDKSGRGNHATQPTATSRPILQTAAGKWYLSFDGVDDGMVTAAINFTATDKMTVWAGIRKQSDAALASVVELTTSVANNGSFSLAAPNGSGVANFGASTRGTVANSTPTNFGTNAAPVTVVLQASFNNAAAPNVTRRINTTQQVVGNGTSPGNYANDILYIGRRGGISNAFNGNMYSIIVRGAASTAQQITDTETYVNSKTGAY